ncbi:di-heme oxidoredictase family protein [Halopseudomonas pachastrellae]|nr:di-heme oxidoredictase family protein [Halopseudomonas pachastrellae]
MVAPSSTDARDGLGPLFNTNSCQGCHLKDGRGHAPASIDAPSVSLFLRLSIPTDPERDAVFCVSTAWYQTRSMAGSCRRPLFPA